MAAVSDDIQSVVTFRLGGQPFAITARAVREVVPYAWLDQPPRMPSFIQGILNLGGSAVPVLRLERLLGLPDAEFGLSASILIMRFGANSLGLLVNHVEGVQDLESDACAAIEEGLSLQGCVIGQVRGILENWALLSWEKLLLREESLRLQEFQQAAQQRLSGLTDSEP